MYLYGKYLGLFFQICDDILDYEKEKKNYILNFVLVYGFEKAKKIAEKYYIKALEILKKLNNSEFLQELTAVVFKRVS